MTEKVKMANDLIATATGATGSGDSDVVDYTMISPIAMCRESAVMKVGAVTHGDANWEKGLGVRYCLNKAIRHIYLYLEGDRSEDHLANARCRLGFAIHSEVMWPHLNANLRRKVGDQLNVPPTVDDATAASWAKARDALAAMREENLAENLRRMKEGVKRAVRPDVTIRHGDRVVREEDGTLRVLGTPPPRVPVRYHILPVYGLAIRSAQYRADLELEGHEVVSRWIEGEIWDDGVNDFDLQACDVAIVLLDGIGGSLRVDKARRFGKPVVAIGLPQPDDFPRLGTDDRHFQNWDDFVNHVASRRKTVPSAR